MAGFSQDVLNRMREKAQSIKDSQKGQFGPKAPRWDLGGKNTIVQPGQEVIIRALPRWDFMERGAGASGGYIRKNAAGGVELNPAYEPLEFWFTALEHWWDVPDGKGGVRPSREWCPRLFDEKAACPVCEASAELIAAGGEDRKHGGRIAAREVHGINAVVGGTGKRRMTDKGLPDIRIMFLSPTLLDQLVEVITGGEKGDEFKRGDVSNFKDGYNLKLTRPNKDSGERWSLDCSPKATPLYLPEEKEAWKSFVSLLHNVEEVVKSEMLSYEALYKAFHGQDPASAPSATGAPSGDDEFSAAKPAAPAQAAASDDLGFDLPPDPAEAPMPGKKAPGKK